MRKLSCSDWRRCSGYAGSLLHKGCLRTCLPSSLCNNSESFVCTAARLQCDIDGEVLNTKEVHQLRSLEGDVERLKKESSLVELESSESHSRKDFSDTSLEPTLEDLDRSIPQVDCEFIAALVRCRNFKRSEFLEKKSALKKRVASLTEESSKSVLETSSFRRFGGLDFWRRRGLSDETDNTSGAVDDSVIVSPEVLNSLTETEADLLNSSRPEYKDGFILLDCRTVNEVTSWGIIEGAKVLPAHELFSAFQLFPEEFENAYGFPKPHPEEKIICYCQYGPRSLMAAQILSWMGYLKVLHFREGYYEWGKQYNLLLRRWMEHDKSSGNELRRLAAFRAALEMQREIAPEFNKLPMQEAAGYRLDISRSPGKLLVGEGLRTEAYNEVASLAEMAPLLDGLNGETKPLSSALDKAQMTSFLEQATGIDPTVEPAGGTFLLNDAQEASLHSTPMESVSPK